MLLAEELIKNNLQYRRTRRKTWRNHEERDNLGIVDIINLAPQLRATFVTKRRNDGNIKKYRKQGRCRICYEGRPTIICSACENDEGLTHYFCDSQTGGNYFEIYVEDTHM